MIQLKNLKELYEDAKKNKFNITAYKEGVEEVSSTSPFDYLTNTEYIISSSIGLDTLDTFIEKFGLPFSGIEYILEACDKACKLCKQKGLDTKKYDELVSKIEGYKEEHCYSNTLYEDSKKGSNEQYLAIYEKVYNALKDGKRINVNGMLSRFGEAVIPDLILAHYKCREMGYLMESLVNQKTITDPTFYQWVMECMEEFNINNFCYNKTLEGRVEFHKKKMNKEFAEKVITERSDLIEITESEIDDIQNLINFKEYATTFIRNSKLKSLSEEVYNLYETFAFALDDEVKEDVADSVIPNLPNANTDSTILKEDNLSGKIPGYLKKSVGIEYGEEDVPKSPKDELKEYERPKKTIDPDDLVEDDKEEADPEEVQDLKDEIKNADTKEEKQQAINNYYYYTYTHSFNTDKSINTNSNSPNASISTGNKTSENDKDSKSSSSSDSTIKEAVKEETDEDIEKDRPTTSLQDTMTDVDRALAKTQQKAKKVVQGFVNVGATFLKPFKRTSQWVSGMVSRWKQADENNIKEKLSNPHERSALIKALKYSIIGGALFKAGLLLNPIFLFLTITRKISKSSKEGRLRNELIGELRNEIEVIEEKIKDADRNGDNKAKYRLMRIKNEINKKLLRLGIDLHGGNKGREMF